MVSIIPVEIINISIKHTSMPSAADSTAFMFLNSADSFFEPNISDVTPSTANASLYSTVCISGGRSMNASAAIPITPTPLFIRDMLPLTEAYASDAAAPTRGTVFDSRYFAVLSDTESAEEATML